MLSKHMATILVSIFKYLELTLSNLLLAHYKMVSLNTHTCLNVCLYCLLTYSFSIVPSIPLNFQLFAVSSTVLAANCTPPSSPNGIVTAYTVYCTVSLNQTYPEQVPTGATPYTVFNVTNQTSVYLSGLLPFTFYQCYVTANTSVGEGSHSNIGIYQTRQGGKC